MDSDNDDEDGAGGVSDDATDWRERGRRVRRVGERAGRPRTADSDGDGVT